MIQINSKTSLYCIFGNPVGHSLSPVMQNAAFQAAGISAVYLAFQPDNIVDAIHSMRSLGISGASVTIPYKVEVMNYIDDIDNLGKQIGSVNTLLNNHGKITGYNTDGYGVLLSLQKYSIPITGKKILIIGNGGSARAISFTLLSEGAHVTIAGRDTGRVQSLAMNLKQYHSNVESMLIKDLNEKYISDIDIIINATSVGMTPKSDYSPIDERLLLRKHTVFDIVYSPNMTQLLAAAQIKGCTIIFGKEMLLYQGVKQFEIWTGLNAPVEEMRTALENQIR